MLSNEKIIQIQAAELGIPAGMTGMQTELFRKKLYSENPWFDYLSKSGWGGKTFSLPSFDFEADPYRALLRNGAGPSC